ncbi:MAG: methionyl-tRNA formyltransferase [Bacteroidetes bacterium]|nr:methionyl-tRNA formyltransferase [Bacteroidota bacterium]
MKIVFFGTPYFAVPVLEKIYNGRYEISAVVTAPDKERGRGKKVSFTPVKDFAVQNNLTVLQPEKLNDEKFVTELRNFNADLFIIVAFKILPKSVFTIPPKGSFNLHGSLLPKYRGAAPIQWSLINGDKITGLTTFFLQEKVDTGNMILQKEIIINDEDNFGSLHDKMSAAGAELVFDTIKLIEEGKVNLKEQDDSLSSPAPKITKELCEINWTDPAEKIHNLIRGLSPYPGAFFKQNGKIYKIYKTKINSDINLQPGKISQTKKEIFVGCGINSLEILEIQPEGRKRMMSEEFLRGYSLI